jgi:hypothetical protein
MIIARVNLPLHLVYKARQAPQLVDHGSLKRQRINLGFKRRQNPHLRGNA